MAHQLSSEDHKAMDNLAQKAQNLVNEWSKDASKGDIINPFALQRKIEELEESLQYVLNVQDAPAEIEPCEVSDQGCLAPAAIRTGSGIADGTESADFLCYSCGLPVCAECSQMLTQLTIHGEYEPKRTCNNCKHDHKERFL